MNILKTGYVIVGSVNIAHHTTQVIMIMKLKVMFAQHAMVVVAQSVKTNKKGE